MGYHPIIMSKPSPPRSPTSDDDASLDASLQQQIQNNGEHLCYGIPLRKHDYRDIQVLPPPLPMLPDLVAKKPVKEQVGLSNADNTNTSFQQSTSYAYSSNFDYAQRSEHSSTYSTLSINNSTSSSPYEMNNEVMPNVSAYFLYQHANRDHFKMLNPMMTQGELSKYTSQRYKSLTPQEKAAWTAQASLVNATNLKREQGNNGLFVTPQRSTKSKKRKDPNIPKRAVGAYVWFTMDERPKIQKEFKGIKFAEMGRLLGERWRGLDPDERKKYNLMASEDRKRLQTELKAYKEEQSRLQKARKVQADSMHQPKLNNNSQPDIEHQPVAVAAMRYNPDYDFSDEFCSDIIKRLSED